jgi:hypothetical protein
MARPRRRLILGAALLAVVASMGTLTAGTYLIAPEAPRPNTGTLLVNTSPAGAAVTIDGRWRGTAPLVLALLPGEHLVEVAGETGQRSVPVYVFANGHVGQLIELPQPSSAEQPDAGSDRATVAPAAPTDPASPAPARPANAPVTPPAAAASGWISVAAPADVQVYLRRQLLGSSLTSRIAAPVGRHEIQIVNEALGYDVTRTVAVAAGKVSRITLDWPRGSLAINALPWAEVSIDGERIGETPIGNVELPIGPHEVVFTHPELGEARHLVTVTATAPARLSVDLRKK